MDWCKSEPLGAVISPPFTNGPQDRNKTNMLMVLDQFPLDAERYRARDVTGDGKPETFCNFYTRDYVRAMGVPLPEGETANSIFDLLHKVPDSYGYRFLTKKEAETYLEAGKPVIAIAHNSTGPGHVAPCRTSQDGTIYVNHVGQHNAKRIPVSVAFGHLANGVEFWGHN